MTLKNLQRTIILSRNKILKKEIIIAGDFNMNLLDFEQNKKSPR